uniref:Uncharacterized protein n=1 Tax=Acrobeloides nanus TaxID=290746 RepID=A0A914DJW9_9BILA
MRTWSGKSQHKYRIPYQHIQQSIQKIDCGLSRNIDLQSFPEFVQPEGHDLSGLDPVQLFELFDEEVYKLQAELVAYANLIKDQNFELHVKELKVFVGNRFK